MISSPNLDFKIEKFRNFGARVKEWYFDDSKADFNFVFNEILYPILFDFILYVKYVFDHIGLVLRLYERVKLCFCLFILPLRQVKIFFLFLKFLYVNHF